MRSRVSQPQALFTIGYQGRTVAELVELLTAAGVDRLVDIRALPLSRRKGLSKTPLREALARAGIEYIHLREAGNPYRALKTTNLARCFQLYRGYLRRTPDVVAHVEETVAGHRAALLCVEQEPETCHRSILLDEWSKRRRRKRRVTNL